MAQIQITKLAWKKMSSIIRQSKNKFGFLYSAEAGGCNGFNFNLNLMNQNEYDTISNTRFITKYENDDTCVYVDPMTEMHLFGTTIDYIEEDFAKGLFENKFVYHVDKDLMRTCGCGTSFTLK
tara:strand:- start:4437 stop:4805 length:369 start_codon:yes stop_codon:yes gene_type:complete